MKRKPHRTTADAIPMPPSQSNAPIYAALAVSLVALVGTLVNGYWQAEANKGAAELNFKTSERASDIHMIEIAVNILRAPISDDVASMRTWAMDVIDSSSKRKLTPEERAALLKKPLGYVPALTVNGSTLLSGTPNPCAAFRRNPDGSWTQTGKIVMPGNNVFEGTAFKNTSEAKMLDQLCGTK